MLPGRLTWEPSDTYFPHPVSAEKEDVGDVSREQATVSWEAAASHGTVALTSEVFSGECRRQPVRRVL